jgi:hypothetical protein
VIVLGGGGVNARQSWSQNHPCSWVFQRWFIRGSWAAVHRGFKGGSKTILLSPLCIAIYIKKYLKAKEEIWKLTYFTMQKYNLQNNPPKENQNPSRYYYNSL